MLATCRLLLAPGIDEGVFGQFNDDGRGLSAEHLMVIGGSYVGLEFAQMYRAWQ